MRTARTYPIGRCLRARRRAITLRRERTGGSPLKRRNIELLWDWLTALRRRDTEAMMAALHSEVHWQGIRPELVCDGPEDVVAMYMDGYDDTGEIDSLELVATDATVVLGARAADLGVVNGIELGGAIYNVFTIEKGKISRIADYLDRAEALRAAGVASG